MNYPRPQMKRSQWQSLDGEWMINGRPGLVPECRTEEKIVYEKQFCYQKLNDRVLLHFGAADQIAEVWLNGGYLGRHIGGYLPFTFEITDQLKEENLLRVEVTDTLDHTYPYGKQRKDRGGMWYTPISGLWKSVWLESVPETYISEVRITPDLSGATLEIKTESPEGTKTELERVTVENPELWTPENPKLYPYTVKRGRDEVEIYFALRTIEIREINGISRVLLNGKPIFLHGVLDQGYFREGIYTPGDMAEYERDVLRMKELGLNCIRKHIKIEPEEFYYACDRLGILVMQDMVNSGEYRFFRDTVLGTLGLPLSDRKKATDGRMEFFITHSIKTIRHLYNHPSIIAYTIFNEGWGQFESDMMYDRLRACDSTRLYDSTSGWFAQKNSDFDSEHIYFRLKKLKPKKRPLLVSECGGYSYNLSGQNKTYGYGKCTSREELTDRIEKLYTDMIIPAIASGCCGSVYTQLSDVEDEINGLYSYDRKVCKADKKRMLAIAAQLMAEIKKTDL